MWHVASNAKMIWRNSWVQIVAVLGVLAIVVATIVGISRPAAYAASGDWSMFLEDIGHSGFNSSETIINPTTAHNLKVHWTHSEGAAISSEPVIANGLAYWGSWDGLEHATNLSTGNDLWTTNLGQLLACKITTARGVLSTTAVASVSINGTQTTVVFVAGGNATFYALDANTGSIIWQTVLGTLPKHFIYGSPVVYNGSVYIGMASYSDCPVVQGQLIQLNASTGAIAHTFKVVPNSCIGGAVWDAPSIDAGSGLLYFGTGNEGTCSTTETMTDAVVALHASDLSFASSWQIPAAQREVDGDFGSTPTLFNATIGGVQHLMMGLVNKNGIYYAFDRTNLSSGPLWQVQVAVPGGSPDHGSGSISSSAWDGTRLYVGGAVTTINGSSCNGSIRALDPTDGNFLWQICFTKNVLDPVVAVPGLAIVGAGRSLFVINATTGQKLYTFTDSATSSRFWGPASISNGVLYIGNMDGNLYAFGL